MGKVKVYTQDSQKVCFLYLVMPKNSIFSSSAKHPLQGSTSTLSLTTSSTHTFALGPLQFQSTGQNTYLTSKTVILARLAFKKNSTHFHSNRPKLSPVSESSAHPLQNYVCFFPLTSRPGSYAHKPTPCHCP